MKPIVVIGSSGQLGGSLAIELKKRNLNSVVVGRDVIDLMHSERFRPFLKQVGAGVVINAAAYTDVAKAESDSTNANKINGEAPGVLARVCASLSIPFVTYSTDYVFDGKKAAPYTEDDEVNPLSEYGKSKALGEKLVAEAGGSWLIFRTSWVFAPQGKNFVSTMLKLAAEKEELQVVSDQIGSPSYAPDLASATLNIIKKIQNTSGFQEQFPSGIYQMCNSGHTSWYDFAEKIFKLARAKNKIFKLKRLNPVLSHEYKSIVARPLNSVLSTEKLKGTFSLTLRNYEEALADFMESLK